MYLIWSFLDFVLMILQMAIFAQVILSWLLAFNVVNRSNQFVGGLVYGLDRVLEPIYRPVRRVLPDFGALDLSPLVILLLVSFLRSRAIPYLMIATMPEAV